MRRRFWPHGRANQSAAVALAGALGLILLIASPGFGGRPPGDPALFAKDARVASCGGTDAPVSYVFAIPHARDYQTYLPAMDPTIVLDLDTSALVIVFQARGPFTGLNRTPVPSGAADSGVRDVCIYVGDAGGGELNFFTDVKIAGLRIPDDAGDIVPVAR